MEKPHRHKQEVDYLSKLNPSEAPSEAKVSIEHQQDDTKWEEWLEGNNDSDDDEDEEFKIITEEDVE